MNLGNKIKQRRVLLQLTQQELANRCELTKGYISQLESDSVSPSLETLEIILDVLGISLSDFFKDDSNQKIIFTTKGCSYYDVPVDPDRHTFQFSVTNHYNDKFVEPNVPSFDKRVSFYRELIDEGFKIGLRVQPFIPNVTDLEKILDSFREVSHITLARLKFMPQRIDDEFIEYIGCSRKDFINRGLYSLKDEIRFEMYQPLIELIESRGYTWNISDNDMRFLGTDSCCCGDKLCDNPTQFDTRHLIKKYGLNYSLENGLDEIGVYYDCDCKRQFTSNRMGDCKTVSEFYKNRFDNSQSPLSPKAQYKKKISLDDF
jgi:transcriptional regulator with XRE-family HTH domain